MLNKARIALEDAGGASSDYHEESSFSHSVATVLETLDSLRSSALDTDALDNLQCICQQIQGPLTLFLDQIKGDFGDTLGPQPGSPKLFSKVYRGPRMVQWAVLDIKKRCSS